MKKRTKINILQEIHNVINLEIKSIQKMNIILDKTLEKIVYNLYKCKGKVIITGIGKSGLIGEKIAATLTSTGTPSIFLHPAEGMHGNIGIIKKNDILITLSKSGESDELISIVPSIKKIGAKLYIMTSKPNSTLAKNSDGTININVVKEACPFNLAPTCSTTSMLVLGDAIAVTLMKMKNFKSEHFALYHPGGQLGKRLLFEVKDIMRKGKDNPTITINSSIKQMLVEITKKGTGAVSVVNKNKKLIGLITDFDIRKILENQTDIFSMQIKDIMNSSPKYIYSDEKAIKALNTMENRKKPFSMIPVLDRKTNKLAGMIHLHDLLSKGM